MRILVTGAAGFIGSHVAEAYRNAGQEVVGADNLSAGKRENLPAGMRLWEGDLADEQGVARLFEEVRPEIVSHHAAHVNVRASGDDPQGDARTNILASLAVLQQAVRHRVQRIIYSSSGGAIYGEPVRLPVTEDHPIRPISNYAVSKFAVELYLEAFRATFGLPYAVLRYPNVFGPRQNPRGEAGVVAIFTSQLLRGERPRIFGDGSKTRDYVYVSDIVEANLRALDCRENAILNLGWGRQVTDLDVFRTVARAVGSGLEPIFDQKRPGEIEHICLEARRAYETLGWKPEVSFEEGVELTAQYFRELFGKRGGGDPCA